MGPFLLEDNRFKIAKGLVDYVQDQELHVRTPHFPRFILVVSSSDILLVVSTLDVD